MTTFPQAHKLLYLTSGLAAVFLIVELMNPKIWYHGQIGKMTMLMGIFTDNMTQKLDGVATL